MPGRHVDTPTGRAGRRVRRLTGLLLGTAVLASTVIIAAPAGAATVDTQLSFTGLVTTSSPTGGSIVGVKPGDTVKFRAATLPTAGLGVLGLGELANTLNSLLNSVTGLQIQVNLPATFPGGKRTVKLGACNGAQADVLEAKFNTVGTYNFTYSLYSVNILCLLPPKLLTLDGNALKSAGIALNATNQYIGQVVVAANPPKGGISVQLPGISVAPSLPVVGQLPTIAIPNLNLPTIGIPIPTLSLPLPIPTIKNPLPGAPSGTISIGYQPQQFPQTNVVPSGGGCCGAVIGSGIPLPGFGGVPGAGGVNGFVPPGISFPDSNVLPGDGGATAAPGNNGTAQPGATVKPRAIEPRANIAPTGSLPVILAILAIIALSLVTATYARLYLLRREA